MNITESTPQSVVQLVHDATQQDDLHHDLHNTQNENFVQQVVETSCEAVENVEHFVTEGSRKSSVSSVSSSQDMMNEESKVTDMEDGEMMKAAPADNLQIEATDDASSDSSDEEDFNDVVKNEMVAESAAPSNDQIQFENKETYDEGLSTVVGANEIEKLVESNFDGDSSDEEKEDEKREETAEIMIHDRESAEEMQPVESILNPSSIEQLEISEAVEDGEVVTLDTANSDIAEVEQVSMEDANDINKDNFVVEPVIASKNVDILCESEDIEAANEVVDQRLLEKDESIDSDSDEDRNDNDNIIDDIETRKDSFLVHEAEAAKDDSNQLNSFVSSQMEDDRCSTPDSEDSVIEQRQAIEVQEVEPTLNEISHGNLEDFKT